MGGVGWDIVSWPILAPLHSSSKSNSEIEKEKANCFSLKSAKVGTFIKVEIAGSKALYTRIGILLPRI